MHPDLLEIIKYAVNFKSQFGFMRITTNCTIVPDDAFFLHIKDCGVYFDFVLDDYGPPSFAHSKVIEKMRQFGIPHKSYCYTGNNQYFNGWIDFGDHTDKCYNKVELEYIFTHCTAAKKNTFYAVFDGHVHQCLYSLAGQYTGRLAPKQGEWIDLFDESLTREQKREIAARFLKTPFNACRYCNGFLSDTAPRIPAGKQPK
jgi:hypothetical protein